MKGKSKLNKWQVFEKKQVDKDGEKNTRKTSIFDNQLYTINTHTLNEYQVDVVISSEMVGENKQPLYVEVEMKSQSIKFVVQIVEESLELGRGKNYVSILRSIPDLLKVEYGLGFKFQGQFRIVDPKHEKTYNIDIIELTLKDYFVSRRDQMKINQKLKNSTVFINKQCLFGPIKINVTNMLTPLKEYAYTGIINSDTKIIYRSQEARVSMLIELSQDLFDTNHEGEVALEFLQKFLRFYQTRNAFLQTNHKLEVILYARLYYPQFTTLDEFYQFQLKYITDNNKMGDQMLVPPSPILDHMGRVCVDVYKKVIQKKILRQNENLHQNCMQAVQELLYGINWTSKVTQYKKKIEDNFILKMQNGKVKKLTQMVPECQLSGSPDSNLLEAIALTTQTFSLDYATRSLTHSGHSIIIVSAGTGFYHGEEHFYKLAKVNAMKNNISVYMVAFKNTQDLCAPMILLESHMYQNLVSQECLDKVKVNQNIHTCIENLYFQSYQDIGEEPKYSPEMVTLNRLGQRTTKESDNLIYQLDEDVMLQFPQCQRLLCGHNQMHTQVKLNDAQQQQQQSQSQQGIQQSQSPQQEQQPQQQQQQQKQQQSQQQQSQQQNAKKPKYAKHAYWITIIYMNDHKLRSFSQLYEIKQVNDFLWMFLSKTKETSYQPMAPLTIIPYIGPRSNEENELDRKMKLEVPLLASQQITAKQLDQTLIQIQTSVKQSVHSLSMSSLDSIAVDQKKSEPNMVSSGLKLQTPSVAQSDKLTSQPQNHVNIFKIQNYQRQKETNDQTPPQDTEEAKKIQVDEASKSTKLYTHYRMKWDQFYFDSKIHGFVYTMKEQYHKQFRKYLMNESDKDIDFLFEQEKQWKNLCSPPLLPLFAMQFYKERRENESNRFNTGYFRDLETITDFINQLIGLFLSENYQNVLSDAVDQYGNRHEVENYNNKNVIRLIKGENVIQLTFTKNNQSFNPNFLAVIFNFKKLKPIKTPQKYNVSGQLYPIQYRYLLFDQRNGYFRCKETLLQVEKEINVYSISSQFADDREFQLEDIQKFRPKRISLVLTPHESISPDESTRAAQRVNYANIFQNFLRVFSEEFPELKKHLLVEVSEARDKDNELISFNLKYETQLKNYQAHLHPAIFESLTITMPKYYTPLCTFHITLFWISSSSYPIVEFIKVITSLAKKSGLNILQIPQEIGLQMSQDMIFDYSIKIHCTHTHTFKQLKQYVLYPPFEFVQDFSTTQDIYIHRKGLVFLKFEGSIIIWKENTLRSENPENTDQLYNTLSDYVKVLDLLNGVIDSIH